MHVAGVRFTTFFILTHIKRFFIMFQTNYWTDVFVVRLLAHRGEQAAETRSVQSNIVQTEFWLMICSRQRLDR